MNTQLPAYRITDALAALDLATLNLEEVRRILHEHLDEVLADEHRAAQHEAAQTGDVGEGRGHVVRVR